MSFLRHQVTNSQVHHGLICTAESPSESSPFSRNDPSCVSAVVPLFRHV